MIQDIVIVLNLILIESLLSVDNAAVLSIMVKDLPFNQQKKALRYGILGAFVFRGVCLLLAKWLMQLYYLKILGGIYLIYLVYKYCKSFYKEDSEAIPNKNVKSLLHAIVLVEFMDLAFSIDNIFAAVALTPNIYLILTGVFIGILAMRFIAGWFVKLIYKYPSLEASAYVVICILGIRLITEGICKKFNPNFVLSDMLSLLFSLLCMSIFFIPLLIEKNRVEVKD